MADMQGLKDRYLQHVQRLARASGTRVRDVVALAAPNGVPRFGSSAVKIRDSIGTTEPEITGTSVIMTVFSTAPQALFTDQGTAGPYIIRPRSAGGTLFFFWANGPSGAGDYAFNYVTHPGTRAQEWFSKPMVSYWHSALLDSIGTT